MNNDKQINALQDLIIRLQDSEKGHTEIANATQYSGVRALLQKRTKERHEMHRALEAHVKLLGDQPEVKTSILGELHRAWIDFKVNNFVDSYEAISSEIKRGAETLMDDYDTAMSEVVFNAPILQTIRDQRNTIERELKMLPALEEKFPVEA